jgi:Ca2+-binding RTX toxin-like protein
MITGGGTITTNGGGTFDLSTKLDPKFNFSLAAGTNDGTTLIGNDQVQQGLSASQYGNDTLIAGNGLYDILTAGQGNDTIIGGNGNDLIGIGSGVDTVKGGTGNDYFIVRGDLAAGTTIDGGGGNDTLITSDGGYNDLSGATITNVQTLRITRAVLTADELNNVSTINTNSDDGDYYGAIYAATGGTYSLAGKNTQNEVDMYATSAAGTTLIGNDSDGETLYGSATGNDTLIAGNGAYDGLQAGGGNDTLKGGTGYDMYEFVTSFGKAIIDNTASGANTTASGEVDFYTGGVPGNGLNASNLWFQRSGNDLLIDELGTTSQIDIAGWYGNNPGAQVQSFHSSDGLVLDTQLAQLVQAMAIYSTNNLGFNAATATAMPNDPTLQGAIAAAWHH